MSEAAEPVRLRARAITRINAPEIDVLWDRVVGTFTGVGAETLRSVAEWCNAHGGIVEYWPTGLRTKADALHDEAALALIFARLGYVTPEPLRPALHDLASSGAAPRGEKGPNAVY